MVALPRPDSPSAPGGAATPSGIPGAQLLIPRVAGAVQTAASIGVAHRSVQGTPDGDEPLRRSLAPGRRTTTRTLGVASESGGKANSPSRTLQATTQRLRHGVQERRQATQRHRAWLGLAPLRTELRERHVRGVLYLRFLKKKWAIRAHNLWKLRAVTLRDFRFCEGCEAWPKAVREVQRVFPGTEGWLLSCSDAEGWSPGFDRWVGFAGVPYSTWLRDSNTVGGPMQFRFGTFTGMYRRGVEHVRLRGYRLVPLGTDLTAAWRSALGQALAGGWARWSGNDDRHWSASWSRGC